MAKDKTTKNSNGQHPRCYGCRIPLSEETYPSSLEFTEQMLQYGGHLPRHENTRIDEEEDEPRINPVHGLYPREDIEKFGDEDMRRKKCHILDCVLDTFPEHLKTKAKTYVRPNLKCKDRIFILPSHEILVDGEVDRGSPTYGIT